MCLLRETQVNTYGVVLGSHGLFTWGDTQEECYVNSIRTIDQMGEFVEDHAKASGLPRFGGPSVIVEVGAVLSSVKLQSAGVASVLPAASLARTLNVCVPSGSGSVTYGDAHGL